ncbi:DUF3298 and DUF4163 domain-containing protein [Clostridium hydrogeniformans]|uniref:DUF3298 and DUF4163 domain-containing protein n=1 Tax=Clostridium hydrogeniformans TaxID=349933 RepID=UPI00068DA898|nr:DUF3298 and DUF4163 domain-containing protein [Clostridium hydrogeniformans]
MKCSKSKGRAIKILLVIMIIFLNITIINVEATNRKIGVVGNNIKGKTKVLDMFLSIPNISGLENKDKEKAINENIEKEAVEFGNKIKLLSEEEKEYIGYNEEANVYEALVNFTIPYNNGEFLSLLVDHYSYTGGAHGITYRKNYNIDAKTGDVLKLKDIFKDNYDYEKIINNIIKKEIGKDKESFFQDSFHGINEDTNFYIEKENMVVYFQLYEITPYASGFPKFKIPLKDVESGIKLSLKSII